MKIAKAPKISDDPRFHQTLFGELADFDENRPPCLYYVENGNSLADYGHLAIGYKMATDLILNETLETQLGNWDAPLLFMVRQTLELSVKDLYEVVGFKKGEADLKRLHSHDLWALWTGSRDWLISEAYPIMSDARFETTEWIIENFQSVDPSGDLFRFAASKFEAFGRGKTFDRAGIYHPFLKTYFDSAYDFVSHWSGVLTMESNRDYCEREGLDYSFPRDPNDFPRKETTQSPTPRT